MRTDAGGVSASNDGVGHTPGPWKYYKGTTSIWAEGVRSICVMTGARKSADPERDANTRLIADAPELLEILEQLIACHDEPTCPTVAVAQALVRRIRAA